MFQFFQRRAAESKADDPQARFTFRLNLFFFVAFLLLCTLVFRLAKVQFVEGSIYKNEMNQLGVDSTPIPPIRGNVYDRGRYPIAYTVPSQSLYFRIEQGQTKEQVIALARRLEEIFTQFNKDNTLKAEQIITLMDVGYDLNGADREAPSYYTVPRKIRSDLGPEEMAFLMEHRDELPWIEVMEESMREYDHEQTVAVQLVGYMRPFAVARSSSNGLKKYQDIAEAGEKIYLDKEPVGMDGIEYMYQDILRGQNGAKTYEVDAQQKIVERINVQAPVKGNNLYLTIDKDVQLTAEKAITDQLAYLKSSGNRVAALGRNAVAGYAVAMEVKTGKVVAMASMPDYNPNIWMDGLMNDEYNQNKNFFKNGTIRDALPNYPDNVQGKHPTSIVYMGSTIKPLSVLIGLKEGLFGVGTRYQDTGAYYFGRNNGSRIQNSDGHAYGSINPAEAVQHSSNTFMSAMIGDPLLTKYADKAPEVWADYLAKFGLGVSTESGLPWESAGSNEFLKTNNTKESTQTRMIYASWGQNEKYTTMQLAQFATTLATRGKRLKPLLVDRIETYEGNLVEEIKGPVVLDESEFAASHWNSVINGMTKVSVQGFEGFPYEFARKTGTSTQSVGGKLIDNAVFVAFAPVNNPTLAVAVVVPEGGFGSWGAAPIARKIFDAYDQEYGLDGTPKKQESAGAEKPQ